jgi:hypothetical protein
MYYHILGAFAPYESSDYFHRLEFQMRGSPHSHGLYWLNNAPVYDEHDPDSEEACTQFIDKYIICKRTCDDEVDPYIKYQIHKHTHTCRKGRPDNLNCRFGFPKPPLAKTLILTPLPKTLDCESKKKYSDLYNTVKEDLNRRGRNSLENPSFSNYISSLELSEDDYIMGMSNAIN